MLKNEAQEKVINNIYGQTIVIACPGSGKTTTLLRRINHMVDEGINPEEILMITFTKAAAREMRERYIRQYGGNAGITFCTIHALCLALLKKFSGLSSQNILTNPAGIIMDIIARDYSINDKKRFVSDILMDISVIKNNNISLKEYNPKCCDDKEKFIGIYIAYEKAKKAEEKIDFDDLLIESYKLLNEEQDVLDWIRSKYTFIHVDEYQDTNYLQRDIIYLIAGPNGNLTVVGDDDQSIYAFRGARPDVMLGFKKDYPDAVEIYMSTNYRSDQSIISHASQLINHNKQRFAKDIKAFSKEQGVINIMYAEQKNNEAPGVAEKIKCLINNGINPNDIAVLYRTNAQASTIADVFMSGNIPFYSNETIESRYNHWMYSDILSYLKISEEKGNQSDYLRTVNHPNRFLAGGNIIQAEYDPYKMVNQLYNPSLEKWKNDKKREKILSYFTLMKYIKSLPMKDKLKAILNRGKYMDYIIEYAKYRKESPEDFLSIWKQYQNDIEKHSIQTIEQLETYAKKYNYGLQMVCKRQTGVCLSTMHRSKGLEWKYVFIIGCVNGCTPYIRPDINVDYEEERRLFYVAMTRAKNALYLSVYKSNDTKGNTQSPFLEEAGLTLQK